MLYFAWCQKDTPETVENLPKSLGEKIILCQYTHRENKAAECIIHMMGGKDLLHHTWAMIGVYGGDTPFVFMKAQRVAYKTQEGVHHFTFQGTSTTVMEEKMRLWQAHKTTQPYEAIFFSTEEKKNPETLMRVTPMTWFIDPKSHRVSLNAILPQTKATQGLPPYSTCQIHTHTMLSGVRGKVVVRWVQEQEYLENWMPLIERCYTQNILHLKGDQWEKKWPTSGQLLGGSSHYRVMQSSLVPKKQVWTVNQRGHHTYMTPHTDYDGVLLVKTTVPYHRHEEFTFALRCQNSAPYRDAKCLTLPLHMPLQDKKVLDWYPFHTYKKHERVWYQGAEYVITQDHTSGVQPQVLYWSKAETNQSFDYGASFFLTDWGKKVAAYALDLAKIAVIQEARTLEVILQGPVYAWKHITLKDTLHVEHPLLPKGGIMMKVTSISFSFQAKEHIARVTLRGVYPVEKDTQPLQEDISDVEVYAVDYSQPSYHIQGGYTWTSDQNIICQSYDTQCPPSPPDDRAHFKVNTTPSVNNKNREGIEMILPGHTTRRPLYHTITGHLPYAYYPSIQEVE